MTKQLWAARACIVWIYSLAMVVCFGILLDVSPTFFFTHEAKSIAEFSTLFVRYLGWYSVPLTTMIVFTISIRLVQEKDEQAFVNAQISRWTKYAIGFSFAYCMIPVALMAMYRFHPLANAEWAKVLLNNSELVFTPLASAILAFYFGKGADEVLDYYKKSASTASLSQSSELKDE